MTSEKVIQTAVLQYLEMVPNCYVFRSAAGAVQTATGRYFRTGRKGCPDVSAIYNGKYYGLEIKSSKGRQSPAQKEAQEQIEEAGGLYYLIRSLKDIKEII